MLAKPLSFFAILLISTGLISTSALGQERAKQDNKTQPMEMSKDQRKAMAKMHRNMAECLESKKTLAECRQQMQKKHPQMAMQDCPMMDGMMGGNMMRGGMGHGMGGMSSPNEKK